MAKKYNVYGLGNALVDVQYRVEPSFFEAAGIEKGVMTLIEEDRQMDLIGRLSDLPAERSSGGSAANTMIGVSCFGGSAYYACKVADDADGAFYLKDLRAAGVGAGSKTYDGGRTGNCLVMITPDADRTLNTFLGITATFGPEQVEADVAADCDIVYIEGYLLSADSGFEAALAAQRTAKEAKVPVALTLSDPFIVTVFGERVARLIDNGIDLLFCNEAEAQSYTGAETTDAACLTLAERVSEFAVTCGPDGARVGREGTLYHASGFPVDAVDTNGAGDMFAGAYLYGVTNGHSLEEAAKLATYASSRVVAKYGPRLDGSLAGEVERILSL
jgi:sugar/nucleoside kinase (ribokinase family)